MCCVMKYAVVHNFLSDVRLFVILMKVYIFGIMSYDVIRRVKIDEMQGWTKQTLLKCLVTFYDLA